ncbi:c2h2 and c2hc zinc finger protein [Rutstroemia sp. NJR-2017a BVV2]|nr:c2h2 and c2hc zinc finger protein [Rutstroemia sp. NJR-2017a BVV2]
MTLRLVNLDRQLQPNLAPAMSLGSTEREESKPTNTVKVEAAGHPNMAKSTAVDRDQERMEVTSNNGSISRRSMDAGEQTNHVPTHESTPVSASSTEQSEVVMRDSNNRAVNANGHKQISRVTVEFRPGPPVLTSNVPHPGNANRQMNHKDANSPEGVSNPRKRKSSQSMQGAQDHQSASESTYLAPQRASHPGDLSTPVHISAPSHQADGSTEARNEVPSALTPERIEEERARLKAVLVQTSPEVAQMVLREQWRNFLFPSGRDNDDNLSFILRAGLKNGTNNAITRVFKDHAVFKEPLIGAISKRQIVVERVLKNASPNQLSDLVPDRVLDQVLAERLKHVPAKSLIRWLAEADRLGYSLDDILDETDESVIPKVPSRAQSHDNVDVEMTYDEPRPTQPSLDPLQADQERIIAEQRALLEERPVVRSPSPQNSLTCPTCFYKFDNIKGYSFHEKKRVCTGEEDDSEPSPTEQLLQEPNPTVRAAADLQPAAPQPVRHHEPLPPVQTYAQPPLHTPKVPKQVSSAASGSPLDGNFRQSPSELDPAKLAALNAALEEVEERYQTALSTIPAEFTPEEREKRMISLKNGNASRKSQIRKSFGVTLRMREKDKEANKRFKDSIGSPLANSTTTSNRFEEFRAPPSSSASANHPRPPPPARLEPERPPHSFPPINAAQPPRPPLSYAATHPPQPPHSHHPPARTYSPNFPPPQQLPGHHPPPSLPQTQPQPQPQSLPQPHPHLPRLPPPSTIQNYDRTTLPPYPHPHPSSTSTSTPPLPAMALSRQDEDLDREHHAHKRLKASPQPGVSVPRHFPPHRPYGSESGGDSRPGSAGEGGPAKKVPVRKAQRMWEALNGSGSSANRDERAGGEKSMGMGVGMLLNKGKEKEVVDLSSGGSEGGGSVDER